MHVVLLAVASLLAVLAPADATAMSCDPSVGVCWAPPDESTGCSTSGGGAAWPVVGLALATLRRRAWAVGLLAAAGCGSDMVVSELGPDAVRVSPQRLTLPGDRCADLLVTVEGKAPLVGVTWQPRSGDDGAVRPPNVWDVVSGDLVGLTVRTCPSAEAPTAGWLAFTFDGAPTAHVWAEQEE